MVSGESEASRGTSLQPWVGGSLPPVGTLVPGQEQGQAAPPAPPHQGAWKCRALGLGPRVCSQQTGSWKGDFSLLILCLRGGIQTPFPHRKPGKLGGGPGRNSLGWPRSLASCGSGLQYGGGGSQEPREPLSHSELRAWCPWKALYPLPRAVVGEPEIQAQGLSPRQTGQGPRGWGHPFPRVRRGLAQGAGRGTGPLEVSGEGHREGLEPGWGLPRGT